VIGVYSVVISFVTPAGWPSVWFSAIMLVLAVAFALSARGNRRYKQVVLIGLSALLVLAVVSLAWA
jgi:hypothetical protein